MVETYVMLKPESEWREGVTPRDVWDEINKRRDTSRRNSGIRSATD